MSTRTPVPASFRDPSGYLFVQDGTLYRQVNDGYREHYDHLISSGLYHDLVARGLMVQHEEVSHPESVSPGVHRVLRPERVPFVSYPYEWCFGQLRAAALATLQVQKRAMDYGMTLKDASAYNIQFAGSRPMLIDTLSFERYREGQLWPAYGQFCRHFLAPLALMSHVDVRLGQLLRIHVDGVPLDLASSLLPLSTRLSFSMLSHLHLHSRNERRYGDRAVDAGRMRMGHTQFMGLIDNLESAVSKMSWRPRRSGWSGYYGDNNYSEEGLRHKGQLVEEFLGRIDPPPSLAWDLGANTGAFSRIAAGRGCYTVAFDMDHVCVDAAYLESTQGSESRLLPLVLDLANPSPSLGWANEERDSLPARGPADVVMALALVHHLAIGNNLPLSKIADFFARISRWLIVEFVPKSDSQVQRLLSTREDIFPNYTREGFEAAFGERFEIRDAVDVEGSLRTLYLMRKREGILTR